MRGLSVVSMRPITSQGSCISELGVCPLTAFLQCPRPVLSVVGSPRSWLTDVPVCVCVCVCVPACTSPCECVHTAPICSTLGGHSGYFHVWGPGLQPVREGPWSKRPSPGGGARAGADRHGGARLGCAGSGD